MFKYSLKAPHCIHSITRDTTVHWAVNNFCPFLNLIHFLCEKHYKHYNTSWTAQFRNIHIKWKRHTYHPLPGMLHMLQRAFTKYVYLAAFSLDISVAWVRYWHAITPFMCRNKLMTTQRPSAQAAEKPLYLFIGDMAAQKGENLGSPVWNYDPLAMFYDVVYISSLELYPERAGTCLCIPREGETMLIWSEVQLTLQNWVTGCRSCTLLKALYYSEVQSDVIQWCFCVTEL